MPALSAASTLDLWERAARRSPVGRAIELAAAGEPPADAEAIARLPVGHRDARLLRLRLEFGAPEIQATCACPACAERIEFTTDVAALGPDDEVGFASGEPVEVGGYRVTWRSPDSRDVAAAAAAETVERAERVLLERCVLAATGPEGDTSPGALPSTVRDAVSRAMAAADPLAEVLVSMSCPACGASFAAELDVAGFVSAEVDARADRILRDVAALAGAFGWTEPQVLALSDDRREAYLELVRHGAA